VAVVKPHLKSQHILRRLQFAKQYKNWTYDDWKKVIWTDESSFEIGKPAKKVRVWRKPGEKYNQECLAPSFKSGRTSVMIWGAFTAEIRLPMIIMPAGRRSGPDFVDLIYRRIIEPFISSPNCPRNLILMEDGAPVHTSKVAKEWRDQRSITKLNWPANSPDLNPIENLWNIMKRNISEKHQPRTVQQMRQALYTEWKAIPQSKLQALVESMPDRIKAVIKAKGRHTCW
jgi:transposase